MHAHHKKKLLDFLIIFRYFHLSTFFPILAYVLLPPLIWPEWFHQLFKIFIISPVIGKNSLLDFFESPMIWYYGSFTLITLTIAILDQEKPKLIEYMLLAAAAGCICAMLGCPPVAVSFFFLLAFVFAFFLPTLEGFRGVGDKITCFIAMVGMIFLTVCPFLHLSLFVSLIAASTVTLVAPGLLVNYLCQPHYLKEKTKTKIGLIISGLIAYFAFFAVLAKSVILHI